ncbi:MAG: carbohydrate kinase family protein [Bacteroidales bacterium]|nr:carbohydrate kinase family protein [Bacteroidales bacterium]
MAIKEFDTLVVGELNVDLILNKLEAFPAIGKEVLAKEMRLALGSSSAIFANNLSILGSKVSFVGKVGYDSYSALISSSLKKAGVHTDNIIKSVGEYTGITVAYNFDNDRMMVTYPGAMETFKISDISEQVLASARHMHLSSVFLQPGLKPDIVTLFKKAKSLGLTTSFDPQWDPAEKWDIDLKALLPFVDVFLPNALEVMNFTSTGSLSASIEKIKGFSNIVVVKDGTNGAHMWDKSKITTKPAKLNSNVVDCIGAGDSFNAGFIHSFLKHKPLEECLETATVTGAVNTTAAGGTGAFQSIDMVKRIAKTLFDYNL